MVIFDNTLGNMWCNIIHYGKKLFWCVSFTTYFSEQKSRLVFKNICQKVESSTMWHSENNMFEPLLWGFRKKLVKCNNSGLSTLARVSFKCNEFFVKEEIKCFGFNKNFGNLYFFIFRNVSKHYFFIIFIKPLFLF